MATTIPTAVQQTAYPMGPLSLVQLAYFERNLRMPYVHETDAYDYGVRRVAESGIYPTFGHVDVRTRRWYRDVEHREGEIGHRLTDNPHKIEIVEVS